MPRNSCLTVSKPTSGEIFRHLPRTIRAMYTRYEMNCPSCDSRDIERIHRSRFEKICRRNPKFLCLRCRQKFFRKIETAKPQTTR